MRLHTGKILNFLGSLTCEDCQKREFFKDEYGAGLIDPSKVLKPALVYDASERDHIGFSYGQGYSSKLLQLITGNNGNGSKLSFIYSSSLTLRPQCIWRFQEDCHKCWIPMSAYKAIVTTRKGLKIKVKPNVFSFNSLGQKKTFVLTIDMEQ